MLCKIKRKIQTITVAGSFDRAAERATPSSTLTFLSSTYICMNMVHIVDQCSRDAFTISFTGCRIVRERPPRAGIVLWHSFSSSEGSLEDCNKLPGSPIKPNRWRRKLFADSISSICGAEPEDFVLSYIFSPTSLPVEGL